MNNYSEYRNQSGFQVVYSNDISNLTLTYVVYQHPPAQKYYGLLKNALAADYALDYETSFLTDHDEYEQLKIRLARMIEIACERENKSVPVVDDYNYLVGYFQADNPYSEKLRHLISVYKQYKSKIDDGSQSPRINSLFRFEPNNTIPIENIDLLYFQIDRNYGDLCVGYGQNGCHWIDIRKTDLDPQNAQPQKYISAESYMSFRPRFADPFTITNMFVDWFQKKCPDQDISLDMALGYCVVGKLVMPSSWNFIENSERDDWTIHVLSQHRQITDVSIVDIGDDIDHYLKQARMI